MLRSAATAIAVAFCGVITAGAPQQPQFRTGDHAVTVYATVVDGSGRLVRDLRREDFEIYDNGRRQNLTVFVNDVQPITIVVLLDRSGSMQDHHALVRNAAGALVDHLLPGDRARIGSFGHAIRIAPNAFTDDRDALQRVLDRDLLSGGPSPVWNATWEAMDALRGMDGRRVVLLFSDGHDNPEGVGGFTTFPQVRERARAEEVMVYAIGFTEECARTWSSPWPGMPRFQGPIGIGGGGGVGGRGGQGGRTPIPRIPLPGRRGFPPTTPVPLPPRGPLPPPMDSPGSMPCMSAPPNRQLEAIAEATGGGSLELERADRLASTFARVAEELHHQYLLAFTAPSLDGRVHDIEVRVRDPKLMVRARRSYVASKERPGT